MFHINPSIANKSVQKDEHEERNSLSSRLCERARKCDNNINLLKPTGYVMHQQFNIQELYALPTLCLCVLYLSENKQRLVPLTAQTDWFL